MREISSSGAALIVVAVNAVAVLMIPVVMTSILLALEAAPDPA